MMQGFFNLQTQFDLRDKLHRELDKLRAAPLDVDAAFNFFVTAEHLPEWAGTPARDQRRTASISSRCSRR